jgi:hypothetical protein
MLLTWMRSPGDRGRRLFQATEGEEAQHQPDENAPDSASMASAIRPVAKSRRLRRTANDVGTTRAAATILPSVTSADYAAG